MKTIMIVDAEQPFHDRYSEMLKGTDYEIISAYEGDEALSILGRKRPDLIIIDELILMDIVLEKMAGDTPSIFTKSISEFGDIPFIKSSNFFLRSFKDQMKTGPSFSFPDKTFIKKKLIDEVNTKIEQKITVCS